MSGNVINGTNNNGIQVEDSDNVRVAGNYVGYTDKLGAVGADHNINGDGIQLNNANNSTVSGNYITQTTSTGSDIGSGIYVLNSHDDTIGGDSAEDGNYITDAQWDDIKLGSNTNITVSHNDLSAAARVGIWSFLDHGVTIDHNTVSNTDSTLNGVGGITAMTSSDVSITNNDVSDVQTGPGIKVSYLTGTNSIDNNIVHNVSGNGIEVITTDGIEVSDNTVSNTGMNGIFIDPSNYASVKGNVIHDTGTNGIYVLDSDYATVSGNYIGYTNKLGTVGADHNINGDGIQLNNANHSTVSSNFITKTTSTGSDIGSGIYVLNSHDDTIGGDSAEDGNHITDVQWDDIKLGSNTNITVSHNDLSDAARRRYLELPRSRCDHRPQYRLKHG